MSNNYLLTREGKFITVSDDELYHYKYIKREKVNGKWRYYYPDAPGDKTYIDRKEIIRNALGYNERDALIKADRNYENAKGYSNYMNGKWTTNAEFRATIARERFAGKLASKAYSDFVKTPLGKMYKFESSIDDGRKAVGKILSKLAKKLKTPKASIYKY